MRRTGLVALILAAAALVCLFGSRRASTQSSGLRRVTNTTEEGINLNPSISGDGRIVAFESTEDIAKVGGSDHFRAVRANIANDPATFSQMAGTRAVAPAISQDGSRIAFASKDDPLGTNLDGNSEIFLFDGSKLVQVTNTSPGNLADRVTNGNFQPSISDDGRFIAFSSNRSFTGQNADGNLEIFIYDVNTSTFTQLTNSNGIVGFTDAKISGDGLTVAYIRDSGGTPSTARDLLKQPRVAGAPATGLAANVQSLAMTYGRAISDDGLRVVYSAQTATNTTQVFLFDGRGGSVTRQITSLGARVTEVPLHPTISGDGSRIAFAARRSVGGAGSNSDGGVELYLYDLPTATFSKITDAPSSATADVVSSLSDDGSIVAFNFPRVLSGAVVNSDSANNSEIYATVPPARPPNGTLTSILNGASFGHEPSSVKAVAPNSIAVGRGTNLANTTLQSQRLPDGTFPTNVAGTRVTVNGRPAQIFFVSPTQVNFLVPPQTEIGTAEVIITNSENFPFRGTVPTLLAAPGIFTRSGDGIGEGVILNSDTLQEGPFDPTGGNLRLSIFTTGARNAAQVSVSMGGRSVKVDSIDSSDMAGLDEIHVQAPADLRGAGIVDVWVTCDGRESNHVSVNFVGDSSRAIFINEVLADPPDGIAGDANHDGVRDGTQDEFVELVNGSTAEMISVGGWTIKTRPIGSTTETTRFTFPAGASVLPGEALLVFGGGGANFNANDPVFGCAQVFKIASSSGLSLTNSGLTILIYNGAGNLITQFAYGGSTGLAGDDNQSLARSPDITGAFVEHVAAMNANGRLFSPGLRTNGTPFGNCPGHLTNVSISPASANVTAGLTTQFTAQAFDEYGRVITNAAINFVSDNPTVATVDSVSMNASTGVATATVTGRNQGTAHIQATATIGGISLSSAPATVNVIPRVTRVDISPGNSTINRGQTQQFVATAFDQNNQPLNGVTFSWNSSNTNIATTDSAGLARGVGIGNLTITASTPDGTGGAASASATLNVQVPLVINEINADVANDNPATTAIEGDANRDGVRSAGDDEFVELLNTSNSPVDLSGVIIADATSNRFTFPPNTTLAAGRAVVIFGGGNPPANDPAFGGALVLTASALSLNDGGDTVNVKLPVGGVDALIASQTYGPGGVAAPNDQSLTRSPDAEMGSSGGAFVAHNTATNAAGRTFSPGTRADGTPFGSPPVTRIDVQPAFTRLNVGGKQSFLAHAFGNVGGLEIEIQNVSFIWDSSDTTVATLAPTTGQTTSATALGSGNTTIRAQAGGQQGSSLLSVNPTLSINDVSLNEGNSGATTFTFTVSLSKPAPAGGVTFDIATADGTATTANNDYLAKSLTSQSIPAGAQTYSFDVSVNGDLSIEPNENFFVNVTNFSGATVLDGQGQGTIVNDDSAGLSIDNVTKNEGDSGTTIFTFTVSSSLPAPAGGITFDIATQDNTAIAGSDYVAKSLTNQLISAGQQSYTFDVVVNGDKLVEPNESFFVNVTSANGNPQGTGTMVNDDAPNLVISQIYGGGNNSGAQFQNDFVEVYNRGATTVDFSITPYSIQYASVGSNFGSSKTNLVTGAIAPGKYFLIQESGGTTNGAPLPTPDAVGTIAMASTSGKVALVAGTTALSAFACPGDDGSAPFNASDANIADFVGYGDSATTSGHCYEGPGPAPAPSSNSADFRKAGGCVDTDNNQANFLLAPPNPRNSSSPGGDCKPEITIDSPSVTEGNTGTKPLDFTVSLSAPSAQIVILSYATADDTATAPADYQATSSVLTFNPGETSKTITVLINGDTLDEPTEDFFVNLSNATNAVILDSQGQGSITDNDDAPSLSISDAAATEGDSGTVAMTFNVSLSSASGKTITINYATADNTATAPSDYQSATGTLTFNPGDTTKTITVLANGDTTFEQNETFFVNLSNATNASISDSQGVGTINNDDAAPPTPTFFINDASIAESDSGTTTATFTVTLTPASANPATVNYSTANGSATAGVDYQSAANTLTFNTGETSKQISITINGDTLVEPDETFFVNLTNATGGAGIGDNQGVGTIQNDDVANLVISQVYPGGGLTNATYTNDYIELFNRGTTTVDFSITPYSAQFLSTSGSTWTKTDLTTGIIVPGHYFLIKESGGANGATLPAADANGTLNLTSTTSGKVALVSGTALLAGNCPGDDGNQPFNPTNAADFVGYGGTAATTNQCYEGSGPSSFTLSNNTIADFRKAGGCVDTNDNAADFFTSAPFPRNSSSTNNCALGATPNLSINDVTVTEGNSGTTTASFTVSLSAPAQGSDVKFDIATADGTATTANGDYLAKSLTNQVIPAGQTTYTFAVTISGDVNVESDETFFVNVTNVVGPNVTDGQGVGTIQNDDLPTLSINDVSAVEGNSGSKTFSFIVNLSAPAPSVVTFDIATADGTATTANNDYAAKSLTSQTIAAGQQTYQFDVTVNGDTTIEPNETFIVNVTNVSGATVADGQGLGTIQNDDSPMLSVNDVSASEGDSGTTTLTFNVSLSQSAPASGVSFDITTADGTATTTGNDYVAHTLTNQSISAGQSSYMFDVTVNGDKLVEPNETFFVNVTNVNGATVLDSQGQGTIQNDDVADLKISQVYGGGNNSGATYQNDFVEIFNHGSTTVDFAVTPYSVQYAGVGSNFGSNKTNLTVGSIAPGKYFLVEESGGTSNGLPLPAPDTTGSINLGSTAGKVALVAGTTALAGATCPGDDLASPFNPNDATIADFVGYGNAPTTVGHCYDGLGPAPAPTNTSADFRKAGGCIDTNDNTADFFTATPFPRNASSPANNCVGGATPSLSINDVTVTEGNSGTITATFTVSLSAPAQGSDVKFDIATADGTATTANGDYVAKSLTNQIIPAGQTNYTFTVTINGDVNVESDETILVNITNVVGANVTDGQGVGTIQNDDLPTLSINDVSAAEGNSGTKTFTFTVGLSAPAPAPVVFDIATADGTATVADNDYVARSLTGQTIAAGQQTYQFDVTVNGDTKIEPNETFFVNVTNLSGATVADGQGLGTIQSDDSSMLSVGDVSANEGDSGTTTFSFTVSLSQPAPAGGVMFDIATADGTATAAGNDYVARTLTSQTIPAGQSIYTFDVAVNGDKLVEPNETFFVNVTNVSGATVLDGQGQGTIQNDDAAELVISQIYPGGGLTGATYTNDYIELFNRGTTTIDFSITPYSAQFLSTSGSTWAKTDLTTGIVAPGHYFLIKESGGANGAALPAADASGTLNLTSTTPGKVALVSGTTLLATSCPGDDGSQPFNPNGGTIADFVGYLGTAATANHCYEGSGPASFTSGNNTIAEYRKAGGCTDTNDNAADFFTSAPLPRNSSSTNTCAGGATPNLSINDVTVTEGNSGTTTATFTVSLSSPAQGSDVKFDIVTADGTATTANNDYVAKSLTNQIIPAGQTSYTFTVAVNGDTNVEPDETFAVNVTNASGANVVDGQGLGTIQNDDFPTLSINDVSAPEGNSGTKTFSFTVSLSAPAPAPVTFDIATADGTGTVADNDYVARSLTGQTIAAGQQTYQFDVTVNGDTKIEPNETFFVNVTNVSGATVADGEGLGTIQNDDSPMLSINDVSADEGDSGTTTFSFNVSLNQPAPAGGVTFDISTADGTATSAGNDYVARTLTNQTIPAGQSQYTFDVSVNGDRLVEPTESFFVNVTNVSAATIADGQGVGTIQNDDVANLVISQVYPGGGLTSATYTNDYIELFNRGTTTVDFSITPYSAQFLSTSGSTWAKTDLNAGVIPPGHYFLIKESGGANGASLPAADANGTLNLTSTTPGKVALVSGTTLLATNCPGDDGNEPFNPNGATIADFVGYLGTAATANHCYEGSGPASFTSGNNTIADYRKAGGCTDTNDNAPDFFTSAPSPRNSSSPANNCAGGATPSLSISDVTVTEGNSGTTTATFTVSLSTPAQGSDVTFDIATQDNSATTANNDYVAKSLTNQIIPAGQITYTFTVTVNGDTNVEPNETFLVNITNVVGANVTDGQGVGTIENDDLPTLSISDVSAAEGNSGTKTFSFTVSLSAPAPATVAFDIATADGTATTAGNDYVAKSLTGQTIAAGQQTYQFDVTVNGDTAIETNETFFVNVTNVSGATIADGQGQGTIQNDDSPMLSINDVSANEGNAGTTTFTFSVSLNQPAPAGGVTFDIATADGTATTAANDYVSHSLTGQTIPAGQTNYSFDVTVNGDTLVEPNETFFVNVTNVSAATVLDGQGQGTIQNDDAAQLVISQIYPGGGLSGATYANDFIELFNRGTTTVDFSITPYSAQFLSTSGSTWAKTDLNAGVIPPGHYFLIKGSGGANGATLPAADASGSLNLTSTTPGKVALVSGTTLLATNCPGDDGTQPFNPNGATIADFVGYLGTVATANHCYEGSGPASFTSGNNTIADYRKAGGCTDTNDNAPDFFTSAPSPRNSSSPANNCAGGTTPNLSINDVTVTEGNSGTTTATFTVSLSGPAQGNDVTFDIATQDNSATTGNNDYLTKTLTNQIIPAGQTTYTFTVTVNGDTNVEPNETFFVNVTNVMGASVTDAQGQGTIQNDDLPALAIDDVTAAEGDSGTKTFTFTVSLSAPAPATVTFDIATADGTATTAGNDYVAKSLTGQTIAAGQQTYQFDVTVKGDTTIEPSETFFVNVTNVSGATIADGQGQGTIQNDDSAILSINDISANEGDSGTATFTFTVSLSHPAPAGGVTFDIATADNTATSASNDYIARTLTSQTIPAGQSNYTFDVTVNGDKLVEPNETFFVNVTNVTGATVLDSQGVGTIQNDDVADLKISQVYGGGNNSGATYQNDFVEIFNHGSTTVDFAVTPYSVQYAGVGSNFGISKTNLTGGSIAPGKYFLVQESGGTSNGAPLPTADATGSINIGSTSGKVALVVGTTALTSATCPGDDVAAPFNPNDATIADFVGYGSTATTSGHCYEGSGPATAPSNTTADYRKAGGCTDTNDNAADFFTSTPSPRNSSSPANNCAGGAAPSLSIDDVAVTEGNSGTTTATFTVSLSAPPQGADVTFDIATADGTATTANADYVAKSLTNQIIPAGQTTYTFTVTVNGDTNVEPTETFLVNVTNVVGATVIDGQGQGAITKRRLAYAFD